MGQRGPLKRPESKGHSHGQRQAALTVLPTEELSIPEPPPRLLASSRSRWEAFWQSPMARHVDRQADMGRLIRWIRAWDEWTRAVNAYRRQRIVEGSKGQPVLSPLAARIDALEQTLARAETEFGMTPMSRLRLGLTAAQGAVTAAQLNRMLDRGSKPADADDDEWEPA